MRSWATVPIVSETGPRRYIKSRRVSAIHQRGSRSTDELDNAGGVPAVRRSCRRPGSPRPESFIVAASMQIVVVCRVFVVGCEPKRYERAGRCIRPVLSVGRICGTCSTTHRGDVAARGTSCARSDFERVRNFVGICKFMSP